MGDVNYGISGGAVTAHNLVVGPSGTIVENAIPPEIERQLEALRAAVSGFDGSADVRAGLMARTDELARDLAAPQREKANLLGRLSAISQAAGSASAVTTAATALVGLIGQLL